MGYAELDKRIFGLKSGKIVSRVPSVARDEIEVCHKDPTTGKMLLRDTQGQALERATGSREFLWDGEPLWPREGPKKDACRRPLTSLIAFASFHARFGTYCTPNGSKTTHNNLSVLDDGGSKVPPLQTPTKPTTPARAKGKGASAKPTPRRLSVLRTPPASSPSSPAPASRKRARPPAPAAAPSAPPSMRLRVQPARAPPAKRARGAAPAADGSAPAPTGARSTSQRAAASRAGASAHAGGARTQRAAQPTTTPAAAAGTRNSGADKTLAEMVAALRTQLDLTSAGSGAMTIRDVVEFAERELVGAGSDDDGRGAMPRGSLLQRARRAHAELTV